MFTICTWPNGHVRAKILPRFQFEGKTDVWISQVRHVKANMIGWVELKYDYDFWYIYKRELCYNGVGTVYKLEIISAIIVPSSFFVKGSFKN